MPRVRVLLAGPTKEQLTEIRQLLVGRGFGLPTFGEIQGHTKGQRFDQDVIVIGDASRIEPDVSGFCVAVASVADLARIKPDEKGRPVLAEKAPDDQGKAEEGGEEALPGPKHDRDGDRDHDRDQAAAAPEGDARQVDHGQPVPGEPSGEEEEDGRVRRQRLFARAREVGAKVTVAMDNEALKDAIRARERKLEREARTQGPAPTSEP